MTKPLEPIVGMVAPATGPLESAARVVVLMTELPKITIGAIFLVITKPPALVTRAESSDTKPPALVAE